RRMTGGPSPLEIESAQVAGHIDNLADEIETAHLLRPTRRRRRRVGVDPAKGDLGGAITLSTLGVKHPMLKPLGDRPQFRRAILAQRPAVESQLAEALGQPFGEQFAEHRLELDIGTFTLSIRQPFKDISRWQEVYL